MSLEPKSRKSVESNKPGLSNLRASDSPERIKARSEVNLLEPSSPRYRSPIHTRVGADHNDHHNCPTCEKRAQDPVQVKYHESPPKVRPSHHNIVCEDCSEGSFSQVLKVLCLNEGSELPTGTKKIKIIESAPAILSSSSFPIVGQGKTVQVLYQEVYPPPKPELTSLLPENLRENGVLKFTHKDEERKRVAIRRAEYANRIKGITKTVVTTISPADKPKRRDKLSVDIEDFEGFAADDNERIVRSEKKLSKVQDVKTETRTGAEQGKDKDKDKDGLVLDKKNQSKAGVGWKGNEKDFDGQNREDEILTAKDLYAGEKKAKDDLKKGSYLAKIQELSSVKNETGKMSVKQKILAKLAGKDFKSLMEKLDRNEESENSEEEQEGGHQEIDSKLTLIESHLNTLKPAVGQDLSSNVPQDLIENPLDPLDGENPENLINPENNRPLSSSNSAFDSEEVDSTHYNSLFDKTGKQEIFSNRTFGKTVKSGDNTDRSHRQDPEIENEHEYENSEVPHEYSKTSKFSSPILSDTFHYDRISPQTEDYESPTFPVQSQPDLENPDKLLESSRDSGSGSGEVSTHSVHVTLPVKSELEEVPDKEVPDEEKPDEEKPDEEKPEGKSFTLELHPTFDDQADRESLASGLSSRRGDKDERQNDQVSDLGKETVAGLAGVPRVPRRSAEDRGKDLDEGTQDQLGPGHAKPDSRSKAGEDLPSSLHIDKINQIFSILADPKVVKGLRLLGGFSDYLEKHGKEVLDWKL